MFEIITLLEFFTFVVGIVLAIYVFVRNPKSSLHIALALAALGMAGWNLSIFLLLTELVPKTLPAHLSFAFAALLTASFTWFVSQFPRKIRHYRSFAVLVWLVGIAFIVIAMLPNFLSNVRIPGGYIEADFDPILFPLWSMYYTLNFVFTFILLLIRTLREKGVDRLRLWQITIGFFLFFVPQQLTNLLLPLLLNDFRWNNLGPVFTIFLIFFLANAILRYRLFDVHWILGRGVILSLVGGLVIWVFTSAIFLVSSLVTPEVGIVIGAFIIVLFYRPIFNGIEIFIEAFFQRGSYEPKKATEEIFEIVRVNGELNALIEKIIQKLSSDFSSPETGIIILKSDTKKMVGSGFKGFSASMGRHASKLAKIADENDNTILEAAEFTWQSKYAATDREKKMGAKYAKAMNQLKVSVIIPLVVEGRLVGMIFFGKRRYEAGLRSRDVKFLNLIRAGISPAFENAAKFEEIRDLYLELSQLDKVKSEFIHVVSHRFRTPLSAIRWNLENVLDSGLKMDKETKLAIEDSHNRTLFLVTTLNRLFDTLAIESGKFKIDIKPFGARKALKPLLDQYQKIAKENKLKFETKIGPVTILGDEQRILETCDHLLSNAVIYTGEGGRVSLSIRRTNGQVEIKVSDTGIGIPEAEQERIFEKFYRCKNAVLTYADGAGISLYLAKRIIELHKGSLSVKSKLKEGTTVTVKLPRAHKAKANRKTK